VVLALDLMSTYEGEHRIFGLLGQANLTQNDKNIYSLSIHITMNEFMQRRKPFNHTRLSFLRSLRMTPNKLSYLCRIAFYLCTIEINVL
jgi:hypothetical protein